ncbi:hypothetical protein [Penaeicola halotolerans]|uniref:hypothetical protein n=1 Tax=Penaeicola halotolerans TaxID=2793196 RepID=UPI001CF90D92|nr:hypothetical protein [Penaeicola halotolerans]
MKSNKLLLSHFHSVSSDLDHALVALSKAFDPVHNQHLIKCLNKLHILYELIETAYPMDNVQAKQLFKPYHKLAKLARQTADYQNLYEKFKQYQLKSEELYSSYKQQVKKHKQNAEKELREFIIKIKLESLHQHHELVNEKLTEASNYVANVLTAKLINNYMDEHIIPNIHASKNVATLKELRESLENLILIEHLRETSGYNKTFRDEIYTSFIKLKASLETWYRTQVFIQHLSFFLSDREIKKEKYTKLLIHLKNDKTKQVEKISKLTDSLFSATKSF